MDFLKKFPQIKKIDSSIIKEKIGSYSWTSCGRVSNVKGSIVEANLLDSRLGMICEIALDDKNFVFAEVVGFKEDKALLFPFSHIQGIKPGSTVRKKDLIDSVWISDDILGMAVDAFMNPLTEKVFKFSEKNKKNLTLEGRPINPLERERVKDPLSLGIRSIDGLLTMGQGQRMGIFAGSGVGKSVLMGMIARGSQADCNVIGLIGERGREVREFIEKELGEEGLKKSVIVVSTSDQSPLTRIRAAKLTTSIAEFFASQGKNVLLMMDSLTRVAQASREIGLAVGEPPTAKGYPPSVFALLPKLLERCGPQPKGFGSISGIYTVLVDGDDFNDPIPDCARSILDGHIYLSRSIAAKGQFPAINVTSSISRVMPDIVSPQHRQVASYIKSLISVYEENIDFIKMGTYTKGTNQLLDEAVSMMPSINHFLSQDMSELVSMEETLNYLSHLISKKLS